MKILLTGASSFTGCWFATELSRAGHEVVATFQSRPEDYEGIRRSRVDQVAATCAPVFECSFGSDPFLDLIRSEPGWNALCQHGAYATAYRSPDFDVAAAVANNTRGLDATLNALARSGHPRIVLTGSVFESDEGAGSGGLPAFSPYGLSKALTAEVFQYYVRRHGLRLGKFVIPNPFGPFEEPRFTSYLVRSWYAGTTPSVKTPAYVRDNIHVSLLAKAYRSFIESLDSEPGFEKLNPSGYVESQGAFAERLATAMRDRLDLPCDLELQDQREFSEPRVRINTDVPDVEALGWDEGRAWDELAAYYRDACS